MVYVNKVKPYIFLLENSDWVESYKMASSVNLNDKLTPDISITISISCEVIS